MWLVAAAGGHLRSDHSEKVPKPTWRLRGLNTWPTLGCVLVGNGATSTCWVSIVVTLLGLKFKLFEGSEVSQVLGR